MKYQPTKPTHHIGAPTTFFLGPHLTSTQPRVPKHFRENSHVQQTYIHSDDQEKYIERTQTLQEGGNYKKIIISSQRQKEMLHPCGKNRMLKKEHSQSKTTLGN